VKLDSNFCIRPLVSSTSPEFDEFFAIYEEALPAAERKSRDAIAQILERNDYKIYVVQSQSHVVAFSIVFMSNTSPVALLEYMATKKGMRNAGLGARLFEHAVEAKGERTLLVEVDSEREQAKDNDLRVRRKNFYLRLGCKQIQGLDYLMPQVSDARPPVMDLLYYSSGEELTIDQSTLRSWLGAIYSEVYGRSRDDENINNMITGWAN
jgi:GNAT superfamily N-acetyltransferase